MATKWYIVYRKDNGLKDCTTVTFPQPVSESEAISEFIKKVSCRVICANPV